MTASRRSPSFVPGGSLPGRWPAILAGLAFLGAGLLLAPVASLAWRARTDAALPFTEREAGLMARTLLVSAGAAIWALAAGVPGGLLLGLGSFPARRGLGLLAVGLLAVPPYLHSMAWVALAEASGPLGPLSRWLHSTGGAGMVLGLSMAPLFMLAVHACCRRLELSQVEAARLALGIPGALTLAVLPAAAPWIAACAIAVMALAASDYGVAEHLRVHVQTVDVMAKFGAFGDPPAAAARALAPSLMFALPGGCAFAWMLSRPPGSGGMPLRLRSPLDGPAGSAVMVTLLLVCGGGPLLAMALRFDAFGAIPDALSTLGPDLPGALGVAGAAGVGAAVLGVGLAIATRFAVPRWLGGGAALLAMASFVLPESVAAISLLSLLSESPALAPLRGSVGTLAAVLALRYVPLAWALGMAALSAVPPRELEAARLAGLRGPSILRIVALPRLAPPAAAAALLAGALSMLDLEASLLLTPPGLNPLGVRLYNMIHYGLDSLLAAAMLLLMTAAALAGALAAAIAGIWTR